MTDVLLKNTDDGGAVEYGTQDLTMTDDFDTAIYLAMFGGNDDDPGGSDETLSWWGNSVENEKAPQYRSETQYLLRSIPLTSSNLLRVEEAAKRDLAFLIDEKIANEVTVVVTIPRLNWVQISGTVTAEGYKKDFSFVEAWEASV